jgi:hypothetical protein
MIKRTNGTWVVSLVVNVLLAGAFTASASAQGAAAPVGSGLVLGVRTGFGLPFGKLDGEDQNSVLTDAVSGKLPLWVDFGFRVNPNFQIGAYFQYSFAFLNEDKTFSDCKQSGVSCSGSDLIVGLGVQYHFSPEGTDPWIGLGLGYERLAFTLSGGNQEITIATSGINFLDLSGGFDFKVAPTFGVGPFVSISAGQYSSNSVDAPASANLTVMDPQKKALHEWVVLGVRGVFNL